jgi:hypothetical protein
MNLMSTKALGSTDREQAVPGAPATYQAAHIAGPQDIAAFAAALARPADAKTARLVGGARRQIAG